MANWRVDADAWLTGAEKELGELEERAVPGRVSERCLAAFSPESLLGSSEDAHRREVPIEDLLMVMMCRAFNAGSPRPCDGLKEFKIETFYLNDDKLGLDRPQTWDFLCASAYQDARITQSVILGDTAAAEAACRDHDLSGHRDFKEGQLDDACRLIAGGQDPKKACLELEPLFSRPAGRTYCLNELRMFSGQGKGCSRLGEPIARELCLGGGAFRRLKRDGRPKDCEAQPACRMMRGDGEEACRAYSDRLARRVCGLPPSPARQEAAGLLIRQALAAVGELLARAQPDPAAPEDFSELDSRAELAARLEHRHRRLLTRLARPKEGR